MDNYEAYQIERLAKLEAIIPTLATKADMEALRADVARWTLATVIGLVVGFAGLFLVMGKLYGPPASAPCVCASAAPAAPQVTK
jgi:hypothetical protein